MNTTANLDRSITCLLPYREPQPKPAPRFVMLDGQPAVITEHIPFEPCYFVVTASGGRWMKSEEVERWQS